MSTSKKKKQAQNRKRTRQQKASERLEQRVRQGPFRNAQFIHGPAGAKMSDALTDLVEPYADMAEGKEAYSKLLHLGMIAWNTTLFPEAEQARMIQQLLDTMPGAGQEMTAGLRQMIADLMMRKKALYPDNRRMMVSLDLIDTGNGYRLTVASSVEDTASK